MFNVQDDTAREKNKMLEAEGELKEIQNQFREKVRESGVMENEGAYEAVANVIRHTARELLGVAPGKRGSEDQETWWWNEEVQ